MRERIVYFLGAGFSAPLGLPVMSNFLIRSKDLYFSDPEKYKSFESVFKMIGLMGKAKNYYAIDLFNIEEILSLLEMEDYVGSSSHKQVYLGYLRDVILDLTPTFPLAEGQQWYRRIFSSNFSIDKYAAFVATLFGLDLVWPEDDPIRTNRLQRRQDAPSYGVISLNYDLVLESSLSLIRQRSRGKSRLQFAKSLEEAFDTDFVPLAKLHGSVEPLTIVPPTWNKVASEEVKGSWKLAYRLLADATQIRFLGYSLPVSDTYVRYLLESAVLESQHLKGIDVICLDDSQLVIENRFRSLITFYRLRFRSGNIERYLDGNYQGVMDDRARDQDGVVIKFDKLETQHESFMASP